MISKKLKSRHPLYGKGKYIEYRLTLEQKEVYLNYSKIQKERILHKNLSEIKNEINKDIKFQKVKEKKEEEQRIKSIKLEKRRISKERKIFKKVYGKEVIQAHWIFIDENGVKREMWSINKYNKKAADNWIKNQIKKSGNLQKIKIIFKSYKSYPFYKK